MYHYATLTYRLGILHTGYIHVTYRLSILIILFPPWKSYFADFFKSTTTLYLTEILLFLKYKCLKGKSTLVALIFLYHGSLLCPIMEDFFFL